VAADAVARAASLEPGELPTPGDDEAVAEKRGVDAAAAGPGRSRRRRIADAARRVAGSGAVATIAGAGLAVAGTWTNRTVAKRLWRHRVLPDWGDGAVPALVAVAGWDFLYYWNHRLQHEVRYMWAIHVVHHSSRHYNLSTALRQPVAEALGTFLPYGVLAWLGIRPSLIEQARGINLLYQFWIHTEAIRSIGPLEAVLNSPSHHRVHHGANRQYLDRNHGSILIVWDKLFGTFEPEGEPVVYGLTRNIDTYNPARIASHEYVDMGADVASAGSWGDRISFVARGPGWAYARRA
jgi:sterol desaturase/sphingolipid hydroxylase (fatty acid hydroxylase superfamily)